LSRATWQQIQALHSPQHYHPEQYFQNRCSTQTKSSDKNKYFIAVRGPKKLKILERILLKCLIVKRIATHLDLFD
jgi:hypothetical protein